MSEQTVTTSEAAHLLNVPYMQIWRAIERGLITATREKKALYKRGTNYRIPMTEIERLQQEMGIATK